MFINNTIFEQIIQLIPKREFDKIVEQHKGDKYCKGFNSWEHFISLVFAQLAKQDSLRGIETGLHAFSEHLLPLCCSPVARSTLSYANTHRSAQIFKDVFSYLLEQTYSSAPKHKFRFKNAVYSMDASTIDLCLSLYDWAEFRKTKAGIKLHVKLNHSGYLPEVVNVTQAKCHELNVLKKLGLKVYDTIIFDRGYFDLDLFCQYCRQNIYFVTRLKSNVHYRVLERADVSGYKNISSEQIIELREEKSYNKCPYKLRRIRVKDPETGKYIVLLTNNFKWSVKTICSLYKDRWKVEIFFKEVKQNLKIKSFLGTSKNAVLSQIWVALLIYLLLSFMKFNSKYNWTIFKLMKILPLILSSMKRLWNWLDDPFGRLSIKPIDIPENGEI